MQLEKIDCPICGSIDCKVILKTKDFRLKTSSDIFTIAQCGKCSLNFLNPRPKGNEIMNAYTADFHKIGQSFPDKLLKYLFYIAQQHAVKTVFKKYKKNGKTLDIGCGNGTFMSVMQNNGYDVWGVELNPDAKKFTPGFLTGRIFYQETKDCGFPAKSFDIITCFQSLEHIFEINEIFGEIRRILKDDGILYIGVPNANFFESYLFGPYYYNLEVPRHLYFFTGQTLRGILSKNGFRIERILPKSIFELILTPTAFYRSFNNFLEDKNTPMRRIFEYLSFIPLAAGRLFLCLLFIFNRQNLEVICSLEKNNGS